MQIEDVRVLLRMPKAGYPGGCNFAAAAVLFNLIAGSSVCFYNASPNALATPGGRGKRFTDMLMTYFPWPPGIAAKDGADVFYKFARNPLAHALGLDVHQPQVPHGGEAPRERPGALARLDQALGERGEGPEASPEPARDAP
jgi:hypothetical protein